MGKERATVIEEPSDDGNNSSGNEGSYERPRQGQRKLLMCPSMTEEVAVLSLGRGRSCTQKQQRRRELHTKATTTGDLDGFVDDRGSVGPMHPQQKQRLTRS